MNELVRRIRLASCLGAVFGLFSGTTVFGAERPNIIFIVADDLGWGHVGWQNPTVQTPHLDRLAEGGVKLNHHYVAPVCSPTRVALITGRYWSRFGVLGPLPSEPTSLARAMPSGTATIASGLKASGYRTALVGKWHLGAQPDAGPEAFGFDYFYGIRVGGCTPLTRKWLGTGPSVLWEGNEIIEPSGHITDLFGEAATDWIGRNSNYPFLLFLSFTAPHVPLQESERWMSLYDENAPDKGHQLYWAAISHLDEAVGRVMAEIDRLGKKENTLVVFFGDNRSPGQRNLMQVRVDHDAYLDVTLPGTNLPLRGKKGDVYDGGIRTPTFASWPAVLKPGVCNVPLHVTDWMPTLCALVGHQPAKVLKWDGRNIMPQLQAPAEPAPDRALYTRRSGNSFALRHGEWKLVFTGGQGKAELYDIVNDCGETTDLAAAHPEFVQRLGDLQNEAATNDNDCVASRQLQQRRTQLDPEAIAARIQQIEVERPDKAQQITGWKRVTASLRGLPKEAFGNVWVADVPHRFFTLYDAEGLLPRARSTGFIPLPGGKSNVLRFPGGKLKNWPNLEDVEIVIRPHHAWIANILPLASVDEETQIARTATDGTYALNQLHFLKDTKSCWVENVLEELDGPGEWVLDTQASKLYLWPRGGDAPQGVVAPELRELVRVEGTIDKNGPKDEPVRSLCFRGLTFMHGERYRLTDDDAGLQHDWEMHDRDSALVRLRGAENCTIEQCRFAHSGGGAIRVELHGQKNNISGNQIEHIGGTGILLCGYGPGTKDVNKNNLVYNNHIHHTGEIYSHSPGVMIWQSGENRVANNLIHHTPYTGMIISGCMTHFFARPDGRELVRTIRWHEIDGERGPRELEQVRPYLHTHDNAIEYNEIHHAMEKLGDGNGIYIRGAGAGNVIRRNYVHHLVAPIQMQAAIRTDGGQRDTRIAENLIYKCVAQGIILKLNNRCENNIVADVIAPPRGYCLSLREGPMTGATIGRNIFYSSSEKCVFIDELPPGKGRKTEDRRGRELARSKDADTDYNIYFCAGDPELGQKMLGGQQRDGVDAHSQAVDPLFVDPENGDFRFRPDSPALKMGIVPIDVSEIGLRDSRRLEAQ